jgi:hypothetical protein
MKNNANYKVLAKKEANFALTLGVDICGYAFTGAAEKDGGSINLSAHADLALDLSEFLSAAAEMFGLKLDIPGIFHIIVERLGVSYKSGALSFECEFSGLLKKCTFRYETGGDVHNDYFFAFTLEDFDFGKIPFVSEFAGGTMFGLTDASVIFSTTAVKYGDVNVQAGLSLAGIICGVKFVGLIQPYKKENVRSDAQESPQVFWADINKKISVVSLHRAGLSYGGGNLGVMLDISLAVRPFTLSVLGAGLSVNLDQKTIHFLISGFGVELKSGMLTVGGAFNKAGETYSGALAIGVATVKVTLVGEYDCVHLLAYALVNANFGGPPAFFITGIAAAFGYNKSMILPGINDVPKFPLVAAANGDPDMPLAEMITALNKDCIADVDGGRFISAGIKFTSFNIAESFALFTVGFGDKLTFSLLGVSNITMPPMCKKNPIAFAQLALKAVLDPSDGVFSVQAQLTSESYVLDKACKLTGGFAMFIWFGSNARSGDFVVSLGGYHPSYKKPAHYPDVPRLGMNWQITSCLSVSGEVYFALTPSCLMAGARMSAIYQDGNLKAWFIAQADFLISWKPYQYSVHLSISLGASYTVNFLFIHKTFTIELGVEIDLWGPNFAGKAKISWFIISFTIKFGDINGQPPAPLTYAEFSESFLPAKNGSAANNTDTACAEPLTMTVLGTIIKEKDGMTYVSADGLSFLATSAVPVSKSDVVIRPMGDKPYESNITFDNGESGFTSYTAKETRQLAPTAMWGGDGELREVVGGYEITPKESAVITFPATRFISLDELYELNTQHVKAFHFTPGAAVSYSSTGSIKVFTDTADKVDTARKAFLINMGIQDPADISMAIYAEDAETLFDEDILIAE